MILLGVSFRFAAGTVVVLLLDTETMSVVRSKLGSGSVAVKKSPSVEAGRWGR